MPAVMNSPEVELERADGVGYHRPAVETPGSSYMPFGNAESRNGLQERIRERVLSVRVLEGDVRALPLESGSFDMVIDFGTCYHVGGGLGGSRAALVEIARVLRPGGLFVHETRVAQRLAHPVRSLGRTLPWSSVPSLAESRQALLWAVRRKTLFADQLR